FLCPQNQKILSTNHHYGNPSTRFSVEPYFLVFSQNNHHYGGQRSGDRRKYIRDWYQMGAI
ncbi:hypothetical protein, partial [Limosilactobacillus fermentum]|uniref:hypothetical protein n=1 Tax=Limosilactobacillus fermentum TaxID=1613 RepID=UPI0021A36A54